MSRRKGKKINKGRFVGIPLVMIRHPVFRELNPAALSVWLGIASRYNGYNNGEIPLSCREAADFSNISKNTAARAFSLLEELGIIKCITASNFDCRKKFAREWALTYQDLNGRSPTNEWQLYKTKTSAISDTNSIETSTNVKKY